MTCLEELSKFELAKTNYLKALEYQPEDPIRLSGYASFLYLYGDWQEAFDAHLKLLRLWRAGGNDIGTANILTALRTLALNLHMSDVEFAQRTGGSLK